MTEKTEIINILSDMVTTDNDSKQTNADKIRNMSDEELAEFLADIAPCDHCLLEKGDPCCFSDEMCKQNHLNWLQSKAD